MDAKPQVNGSIDLDDVFIPKQNDKKKVARKRWAILAKALKVCVCVFFKFAPSLSTFLIHRVLQEVNHQVQQMSFPYVEFHLSCF